VNLWHLSPDTPRQPFKVSPNERIDLSIGTWPIESGQSVWVNYQLERQGEPIVTATVAASWQRNQAGNSYWRATLGPFAQADHIHYTLRGHSAAGQVTGQSADFNVGVRLHLALMWHQHQPIYKDYSHASAQGSYTQPWVRLHALRDYYAMAALLAAHPKLHLTINLTPALLWQLEDYLEHGATDKALELSQKPAEDLSSSERDFILNTFFDANWHHQIYPQPRYKELFEQRASAQAFSLQDLRDLQMWFNLSWFAHEFRMDEVTLSTGETVSVHRFVEQQQGFSASDIEMMIAEQYKLMRAVVPIHRSLQDKGQLEIATTPFYHPILPLLFDSDQATIDRPGTHHPRRFAYPEDAVAQITKAVTFYKTLFGQSPRGMWPAEGAVSQAVIPLFANAGLSWIATDKGVLAKSGRWGYNTDDPEVLCQPYRAQEADAVISIFFRDSQLSDEIGFHYQAYSDARAAARDFLRQVRQRFAAQLEQDHDHVLSVILDGENAWGAFYDDARPFLHALYQELEQAEDIVTVTFSECLEGNPERGLKGHLLTLQRRVHDLFTGSWIDENGSAPGVDLGTWIGEAEENHAWELLTEAREVLERSGANPTSHAAAFEALYRAEGSDWFWWFGDDQDSGHDAQFDDLFRCHLKNIYRGLELDPPEHLNVPIVPHKQLWTFTQPLTQISSGDVLTIRTNCPGQLRWSVDDDIEHHASLQAVGGVMAGVQRYLLTLGPFPKTAHVLTFRFFCAQPSCKAEDWCCQGQKQVVRLVAADLL